MNLISAGGMGVIANPNGGCTTELEVTNSTFIFNFPSRSWRAVPGRGPADAYQPTFRYAHVAAVTGDRLVVVGGQDVRLPSALRRLSARLTLTVSPVLHLLASRKTSSTSRNSRCSISRAASGSQRRAWKRTASSAAAIGRQPAPTLRETSCSTATLTSVRRLL